MSNSRHSFFPMGSFRDADEPVICGNYAVLIQRLYNGSKATLYNVATGEMQTVPMKGVSCFNVHADDTNIVFEYMGNRRGIGIITAENAQVTELGNLGTDVMLGGIWENSIIFRRGYDVISYDIDTGKESILVSCRHICGSPVVGNGCCAWLQRYRDKACVALYDIKKDNCLLLSSHGLINGIHITGEYLIYQSCFSSKCSIFAYEIKSGSLEKIFESGEWLDLYKSCDDMVVWTVRKELKDGYIFDVWALNLKQKKPFRILSGCRNSVIAGAAEEFALVLNNASDGDSLMLMPVEM